MEIYAYPVLFVNISLFLIFILMGICLFRQLGVRLFGVASLLIFELRSGVYGYLGWYGYLEVCMTLLIFILFFTDS